MTVYQVKKWIGALPVLCGRIFNPETEPFCKLPFAEIKLYPWDESGYTPEARAYLGKAEKGLVLLMCANEPSTIAAEKRLGGAVCRDSCLEFFFNPRPSMQDEYINIEINCAGIAHIGIGEGRHNRRVLTSMPDGMSITHSRHDGGWWAVSCILPFDFIGVCESEIRANFYTCDESLHPHFGTWNPVSAPQPDFHRPECFGTLKLED